MQSSWRNCKFLENGVEQKELSCNEIFLGHGAQWVVTKWVLEAYLLERWIFQKQVKHRTTKVILGQTRATAVFSFSTVYAISVFCFFLLSARMADCSNES